MVEVSAICACIIAVAALAGRTTGAAIKPTMARMLSNRNMVSLMLTFSTITSAEAVKERAINNNHRPVKAFRPIDRRVCQRFTMRRRMALPITLTDDSAIAAAAMIGESKMPKMG